MHPRRMAQGQSLVEREAETEAEGLACVRWDLHPYLPTFADLPSGLTNAVKPYILFYMKTTLDIPDDLYRAVKSRSAADGLSVRGVTILLYGDWLSRPGWIPSARDDATPVRREPRRALPSWFAMGRSHVRKNADGPHDLESMRKSIAEGIAEEFAKGGAKA